MTIDILKTIAAKESKRSSMVSNSRLSTRSSVCRSLFGEVDQDASLDFLQKELDAITQKEIQRWNFDFVNERPLNDDSAVYEWSPVHDEEAVPKAYALSRLPFLSKDSQISRTTTTTTTTRSNSCSPQKPVCRSDGQVVESRLQDEVDEVEVTVPKTLTQTSINDFMKTRKRLSCFSTADKKISTTNFEESDECNQCCYHPPVEECPSKKSRPSDTCSKQ